MESRRLGSSHLGWALLSLLGVMLLASACGQVSGSVAGQIASPGVASGDHVDISPQELVAMMEEGEVFLVNVHVPYEGDIPGTDASIPFDEMAEHLDELPQGDIPIVLYCRSGPMSTTAAKELAAAGITPLYELEGGMGAWERAGLELVHR